MKRPNEEGAQVERDSAGPRSLMRVLGMFKLLACNPQGMGLEDLSAALEAPRSSLLNLLRPLVSEGFLSHAGGQYRLGAGAYPFFAGIMARWNFSRIVRPFMEDLSAKTNETVLLGVINQDTGVVTYLEIIDSQHPVRYQIPVGTTRPLYASAAGRLLLAYSDPAWLEDYLAQVVLNVKTATPITTTWLRKSLQNIRREGVAWSIDHYLDGLASIAAPVLDAHGRCLASLSIARPSQRFRSDLGHLIATVKEVSARASGVAGAVQLTNAHPVTQ